MSSGESPLEDDLDPEQSSPTPDLGDISADLSEMDDLLKSLGIDAEIIDAEADADAAVLEAVELAGRLEAERDEYLDLARRVQADFENYKRRVDQQNVELRARAAEQLARELLPVLDAGEAASAQGMQDAAAIYNQLLSTLEKQGLARVAESDVEFDPNIHEAVMHEEGESEGEAAVVTEILRTGYLWNDRVLRPAMVKVLG
ncbi:molecular chaperone GrpE (heat shock protein) [Actinobacteria bacterium IMCC26207]|nr:molecular chaperone GrpE (heat shock protein) [Actinobacteria bacterium IMCC26207]